MSSPTSTDIAHLPNPSSQDVCDDVGKGVSEDVGESVCEEQVNNTQNSPTVKNLILYQPKLGSKDYLKKGDVIVLVYKGYWTKAILTRSSRTPSGQSLYWTYSNLDGSETRGSYLHPGASWGVLRGEDVNVDLSSVRIVMP